ncbi:MAG: PKD domain-containing protein [Cyclobacteriaceae bacterium]|nr:PKD domain-containing protein [Cyclobacteriaceae bacterium]
MLKRVKLRWLTALAVTFLAFSCSDDDVPPAEPIASFQFEIDADDFKKVTFTNFSQNASTYSWNFGDGNSSTQENPVHTYTGAGTYTVLLTATGGGGAVSTKAEEIIITDPNIELKKLTGEVSKTWKLIRDVSTGHYPFAVGPQDRSQIWYALGLQEGLHNRPCLLNDEYLFRFNGQYEYKTNGDIWAESGVWNTTITGVPGCIPNSPANFVNVDGADISAWNDGVHSFTYDVQNSKLTLNGTGAFAGLAKVATNAEVTVPQSAVTYTIVKLVDAAVDTLIIETNLVDAGGYWRFVLVHYDNPLQEPPIPDPPLAPGSINNVSFDFETSTPAWTVFGGTDFAGAGVNVERIANPHSTGINTSGFVIRVNQLAGVQGWSGMSTPLSGVVDFTTKQTFKVKVYSPAVGAVVKLKMEEIGNAGNNKEIDATTTVANAWEELTFTFTVDDSNKWNLFVLFFDFQGDVKPSETTFYFDDIKLE